MNYRYNHHLVKAVKASLAPEEKSRQIFVPGAKMSVSELGRSKGVLKVEGSWIF